MNKKIKLILIISIIIILIVVILLAIKVNNKLSPKELKEKLNKSVEVLENKNNYIIMTDLMYGYYGNDEVDATTEYNKTISITFDEKNNITKRIHQ